jgi:sialate O-acetylesterase
MIEDADEKYLDGMIQHSDVMDAWIKKARRAQAAGKAIPSVPKVEGHALNNRGLPTGIYNAMITPLVPYSIKGAIWYQGESNMGDGMLYFHKMNALISGWREIWGSDLSFYYVQLAPFGRYSGEQLGGLWEAQEHALTLEKTGMAVITDIGNLKNIHPGNKKDVGHRLARWALAKDYGQDVKFTGPVYKQLTITGSTATLSFDHAMGLKAQDGEALRAFMIAGEDKQFVKAQAEIKGDTVVVSNAEVAQPVAVRMGWGKDDLPNLANGEGLMASPFRTDKTR